MSRPATAREIAGEIAQSYEKYERNELINILAYLTKTYIVDQTMPFNLPGEGGKAAADAGGGEKELDFAKLIDQLKKRLPKMKELSYFKVEDGRVALYVQNQKISIGGDRVTAEFVRGSSAPPDEAPARPSPSAAVGAAAATGAAAKGKKKEEKGPALSDEQQETLHDIAARFSNLELD